MICRGIKNDIHNSTVKNTDTKYSTASKLTVSNQKNKSVLRNEDITKKLLSLWNNSPFTTNHIFNPESKIIKK